MLAIILKMHGCNPLTEKAHLTHHGVSNPCLKEIIIRCSPHERAHEAMHNA